MTSVRSAGSLVSSGPSHGRIDVLVNNAGRTQVGALEETTEPELRCLFKLHFFGPAALTKAVLPHMRRQGGGVVVQLSSVGGQVTAPGFGASPGFGGNCATKFVLGGLTETLSQEVDFGVRCLIVEPGAFRMLAAAFNEIVRRVRQRIMPVCLDTDMRRILSAVLRELLPLDNKRAEEARIHIAFATRAATSPALANIQRTVLIEITDALTEAFALTAAGSATAEQCRVTAHLAVAAADGLALHAVSSGGWMSARQLTAALELLLDALIPHHSRHNTDLNACFDPHRRKTA